ncbi:hypothetical protein TcasGA2_TC031787 [Tribolium castaneum]|uniref:Uncharacterized protein n=1 Tax=Tribolium castaneum TaxID=7070 RepID=A0A139W8H2_TRICA|nr:hypothetical protein TcasGA2_TC031787 [Tribolium castaneum]
MTEVSERPVQKIRDPEDLFEIVAQEHQEEYEARIRKDEAKKAAAHDKREIMKTGGGISNLEMTSEQEVLLATLREQVEPLVNPYDSAADYFNDSRDDFKNFEMPVSELITPEPSTHPSELECPGPSALPPEAISVSPKSVPPRPTRSIISLLACIVWISNRNEKVLLARISTIAQ